MIGTLGINNGLGLGLVALPMTPPTNTGAAGFYDDAFATAETTEQGMNLTVIGGGSTYCPELFLHLLQSPSLRERVTKVTLFDINAPRVAVVGGFCQKILRAQESGLDLKWTTDPAEAFDGAQIIFNMMRAGQMEGRFGDEQVPLDYTLIGQETMGLGGFRLFHRQVQGLTTLLPYLQEGTRVFNFANPSGMLSQWLSSATYAPSMVLGLCNIPFGIKMEIANVLIANRPELTSLGQLEVAKRVEVDSVGLNHYTFFRNFRFDGVDITDEVIDGITHPPANFDVDSAAEDIASYPAILKQGIFPNWYFRYRLEPRMYEMEMLRTPVEKSRAWKVRLEENAILAEYSDSDKPIDQILARLLARGGANYSRMAVAALEAVLGNTGTRHIVNTKNQREDGRTFIPWLPRETYVEVPSHMYETGAIVDEAIDVDLPAKFRFGVEAEAAAQNLWIEAHRNGISKQSARKLMREALSIHPLIGGRFPRLQVSRRIEAVLESLDSPARGYKLPPLEF